MTTDTNNLAKLNRLRVNAGKPELKSWKASGAKLAEAITNLEAAGFTDVVSGANLSTEPKADDPSLIAARGETPKTETSPSEEAKPKKAAKLARGLENEPMARQSRLAAQLEREREKREERAQKAEEKADKKKKDKPPKGKVDEKKDPDKAERQKKHIEDKKKAREGKPPKDKNPNEITVADIARELGIDPKVARAKLRRHEDKIDKLHTKGQDRWTFPKAAKAELVKILK